MNLVAFYTPVFKATFVMRNVTNSIKFYISACFNLLLNQALKLDMFFKKIQMGFVNDWVISLGFGENADI